MFQGVNGEVEAKKWVATLPESKTKAPSVSKGILPANFASKNVIGSDEVGTGDFFGPITVCAAYVDAEMMPLLKELGVKDSKAMKIQKFVVLLRKSCHLFRTVCCFALILNTTNSKKEA